MHRGRHLCIRTSAHRGTTAARRFSGFWNLCTHACAPRPHLRAHISPQIPPRSPPVMADDVCCLRSPQACIYSRLPAHTACEHTVSLHIQPPVCAHTVSLRARMPSRPASSGTADFFERSRCMLLKCKGCHRGVFFARSAKCTKAQADK